MNNKIDRRNFLQRAAIGSSVLLPVGTLLFGKSALGAPISASEPQLSVGDTTVITIGLNSEYLQAEFYLRALTGKGLSPEDTSGLGPAGPVLVGKEHPCEFRNPVIKAIAEQLAKDELAHVRDVRATFASFGLTPPARPTIDLVNSFQTLADAAGLNRRFNPFVSENDFLLAGFFLEQIDVPLLTGAIGALENNGLKSTVASLLGDEAAHNGFIRLGLALDELFDEANQIAALSQKLANSATTIFQKLFDGRLILAPVGDSATVPPLDPRQFLNIIYLNINAEAGAFFPNGLNFI
jgi:hypothetical protein